MDKKFEFDFLSEAVSSGDYSEVERILFKKKSRPPSLSKQSEILKNIRDREQIPYVYRINASIAYLYKMMESNANNELVVEAVDFLNKMRVNLNIISESDNIRFSYTHLFYSINYCLIQAYVFLDDKKSFLESLYSTRDEISHLDFKKQTSAFYSTHIGITKIVSMILLREVNLGGSDIDSHVKLIVRSSKCASRYINTNAVRFIEYSKSLAVIAKVFDVCDIVNENRSIKLDDDSIFFDFIHVNKNKNLIAERLKIFLLN